MRETLGLDFKVDYKLEGKWSRSFATLMTSSCWPLQRQNYKSGWIAWTESVENTVINVGKTKVM